jgi:hypothetical protein
MSKRPLLVMIAILLLMIAVLPAAAQYDPNADLPRPTNPANAVRDLEGYLIVTVDNLFLRSGDGPQYTPLAIIDGGTRLIPLGWNGLVRQSAWWYVQVGGFTGWVSNQHVAVRGDLSDIPIVPVTGEIIPPTLYVGARNPVYSRPGSIRVLCTLPGGEFHIVTGRDAEAENWYRIRVVCGGLPVEGWIQADRGLLRNPGGVSLPIIDI